MKFTIISTHKIFSLQMFIDHHIDHVAHSTINFPLHALQTRREVFPDKLMEASVAEQPVLREG